MLGLLEMGFVLVIAFAWGLHELWSLRRPPTPTTPPPDKKDRPGG